MKAYTTINYRAKVPCVVALGCFDGVHIGHREVIATAKKTAEALGCRCTVWTFDEPPKNFFLPLAVPLITEQRQKWDIIRSLGADVLVSVPFNEETAKICAEDFFVDIIKNRLRAVHVVCGFDYSFGAKGKGNVQLLRELCDVHGIGLSVVPPIKSEGLTVSSSAIRAALSDGDIETATRLLGRYYSLDTVVISGQHLARKLGFPTLNQEFSPKLTVPKKGVYASRITIVGDRKKYYGITNVGVRPTVGGSSIFAETHIFDFSGDIYGKKVKVEFLKFIREERKFDTLEALTAQVNKDIETVKNIID